MNDLTLGLAYEVAMKKHNGELKTEEEVQAYIDNRISEKMHQVINVNKTKRENMKKFIKNKGERK